MVQRLRHRKEAEVNAAEPRRGGSSLCGKTGKGLAGSVPQWESCPECNGKQRAFSRRESASNLQVGEISVAAVRSLDGAWC